MDESPREKAPVEKRNYEVEKIAAGVLAFGGFVVLAGGEFVQATVVARSLSEHLS
jgi:hypothetical protein